MKNMKAGQQEKKTNTSDGSGSEQEGREGEGGSGDGTGPNGEIPPELLEALSDALNDDDFKRTLEQAGKQLGKDMNQVGKVLVLMCGVFSFFMKGWAVRVCDMVSGHLLSHSFHILFLWESLLDQEWIGNVLFSTSIVMLISHSFHYCYK